MKIFFVSVVLLFSPQVQACDALEAIREYYSGGDPSIGVQVTGPQFGVYRVRYFQKYGVVCEGSARVDPACRVIALASAICDYQK